MRIGTWLFVAGSVIACSDRFTNATNDGGSSESGGSAVSSGGAPNGASGSSSGGGRPGVGGSSGSSTSGGASGGPAGGGGTGGAPPGTGGSIGVPPVMGGTGGGPPGDGGAAGVPSNGGASGGGTGAPPDSGVCTNPQCSTGACSRLRWSFDSGELDGIVALDSSGQPLAVRTFDNTFALAVDVGQLGAIAGISFQLPVCSSGKVDIASKSLGFRVYFDGTPASQAGFYVQAAVPDPASGGFIGQIGASTGAWTDYSAPLDKSQFSTATTTVTIQAGSLGGAFSGTIWFDDFRID